MNDSATQDLACNDAGLDKVIAACKDKLPPPTAWSAFPGYPDSLALAVIDAIWSVGIRYTTTEGVGTRYTAYRRMTGGDTAHDTVSDLLRWYASLGGDDRRPTIRTDRRACARALAGPCPGLPHRPTRTPGGAAAATCGGNLLVSDLH